ncbi:MarR family winged helix-turn-helix transcriptional regulator [Sciscionella sediminilitoris]|uniref:MarR family winged helix-turn-helix transcriptional regulator n=1 Tax=Sciscionella sediminilitoris TaxID=1445613 RepID=UPI0004DEFD82|nr:MarR family transcriptional regulator [Sciscionella sp. SE31]
MSLAEDAVEARAKGWRTLASLHARIEDRLERALRAGHQLSVSEFTLLEVLSRQDGFHLRMSQVSNAVVLSQSATTRLVSRLENRGLLQRYLCPTDRRGIYTELTDAGQRLLREATPTHDAALAEALEEAGDRAELAPLVRALAKLPKSAQ